MPPFEWPDLPYYIIRNKSPFEFLSIGKLEGDAHGSGRLKKAVACSKSPIYFPRKSLRSNTVVYNRDLRSIVLHWAEHPYRASRLHVLSTAINQPFFRKYGSFWSSFHCIWNWTFRIGYQMAMHTPSSALRSRAFYDGIRKTLHYGLLYGYDPS